jgi:hypothetical protein
MTEFDAEQFEEKYVHYFEELEQAYSDAYEQLHGTVDSRILKALDRQILAESEPVYEGDGQFRVTLPDDLAQRIEAVPGDESTVRAVLEKLTAGIERELHQTFEFDSE